MRLQRGWKNFFFRPEPPLAMGVFRIVFGLILLLNAFFLYPDWSTWFGEAGTFPLQAYRQLTTVPYLNIFLWMPTTPSWLTFYFVLYVVACIFLTVGLWTRFSSAAVYVLLVSMDHRNIYTLSSGNVVMHITAFFLIFSAAGRSCSVDRLLDILRGRSTSSPEFAAPWAQRLVQIQMCVVYLVSVFWKLQGPAWREGTAVYYALMLDQFKRFPVPSLFLSLTGSRFLTWSTLLIELSLGTAIWFGRTRIPVLIAGALLHLGIEYAMNVQLFEWMMMALLLLFLKPSDFRWMRVQALRACSLRRGKKLELSFDKDCVSCNRMAQLLLALDLFKRLRLFPVPAPGRPSRSPEIRHFSKEAWFELSKRLPILWLALPLYYVFSLRGKERIGEGAA